MSKTLKVGVIGVGDKPHMLGHMLGWAASEHAEVVAGCDISEAALQEWAEKHNIKNLTTDSAGLISDPNIDIIDICTPNVSHAPLAIAALEAGKYVICEKPLATTPAEIRDMIAARDKSGKMLMTAQHFRFKGNSRAMKAEIETGFLGDIYHARSWMLRRAAFPARHGLIMKSHSGGGPCIDIGVHILDLTLWFMGNPKPVAVTGVARAELAHREGTFNISGETIPPEFDVEDFAAAFVRFENGATLILEVSWLLHHDTSKEDMRMWLYGTEGGCEWPDTKFLSANYETKQLYNRTLQLVKDKMEPHALECVEFARAVAEGLPSPVPAEHSLYVQEILDGIYRSQEAVGEVAIEV